MVQYHCTLHSGYQWKISPIVGPGPFKCPFRRGAYLTTLQYSVRESSGISGVCRGRIPCWLISEIEVPIVIIGFTNCVV